jgi:hypothetical protein
MFNFETAMGKQSATEKQCDEEENRKPDPTLSSVFVITASLYFGDPPNARSRKTHSRKTHPS